MGYPLGSLAPSLPGPCQPCGWLSLGHWPSGSLSVLICNMAASVFGFLSSQGS